MKALPFIRVGDRVLAANAAGETVFSEVVFIPHGINSDVASFTHITTESGHELKMTMNHLILAGFCGSTLSLTYASKVSVGDCINTVKGQVKVLEVMSVQGQGVYTVITMEEYLVVNGIIVSPYGVNHLMGNLFYNIHRFVYMIAPSLLAWSSFTAANEVCSRRNREYFASNSLYFRPFCIWHLLHLIY